MTKVDLTNLDEMFAAAEPFEEGDDVPDGKYIVRVERVELRTSQQGNAMLSWELRIMQGEHANRMLFRNNMMMTPQNMQWLKTDLGRCGMELAKLSELEDRLSELLDIELEVTKKTKGEYSNVNIVKRVDVDAAAQANVTGAKSATKAAPISTPSTGPALSEF